MTDNLPTFPDGRTVCVSPFEGGQDISPQDGGRSRRSYIKLHKQYLRLNIRNAVRALHTFVPPSDRLLQAYHNQGMADARRFLMSEHFYD